MQETQPGLLLLLSQPLKPLRKGSMLSPSDHQLIEQYTLLSSQIQLLAN